ncbi:MAG: hypothetical protein ABSE40_23015 [Candidatus Sulfotelmatobacter sp.]|jgi:hypothetical protein
MQRINPEHLDSDRSVAADVFLREEPDEDEDEEEDGRKKEDDYDEENDEGYSE